MDDKFWVNIEEFLTNNLRGNDHFENEFLGAEVIGKGTFGVVYRATKEDKQFAIKLININSLNSLAAALKEATILKDVPPHPNIMTVYDKLSWYTAYNYPDEILEALKIQQAKPLNFNEMVFYIVMEWLPTQLTKQTGQAGQTEQTGQTGQTTATNDMGALWKRMESLTAGLHHFHQHGIVHGDLHLGNLCLRYKDDIVLIDFGLSNVGSVRIKGTLNKYHPPDVIPVEYDGSDPVYEVNQSWDVGAYGVILFDLIYLWKNYLKYPFENVYLNFNTTEEDKRAVLIYHLAPLGIHAERVAEIIVQCTNRDMNKRPFISTVNHILLETEHYRVTRRALKYFCHFADVDFEQRMLYRSWYEELIGAVPNYRQDLLKRLNESIYDDFPYLAVFKYVGVNDIMFLANAYRAANYPFIPLHNLAIAKSLD